LKRGRPPLRSTFKEKIADLLSRYPYPVTVRTVQLGLLNTGKDSAHWCTVKKYLEELTEEGCINRQLLPAETKRKPLTVYFSDANKPQAREDY